MKRSGLVYSTNPNFEWEKTNNEDTVNKADFILSVCFEKKGRAGKGVTIIKGFEGPKEKLGSLAKNLKKLLGVGGSVKNNEIIIQGRIQDKIMGILKKEGYNTKKVGG
mgnify:CR=1 FL=1